LSQDHGAYRLATIRELLLAAFTAEELIRFCQDRPTFRPVVKCFGPGHGLDDMVHEVVTYCETRLLFPELLAEVKTYNPRQYERFEPALRSPEEPPPLSSIARTGAGWLDRLGAVASTVKGLTFTLAIILLGIIVLVLILQQPPSPGRGGEVVAQSPEATTAAPTPSGTPSPIATAGDEASRTPRPVVPSPTATPTSTPTLTPTQTPPQTLPPAPVIAFSAMARGSPNADIYLMDPQGDQVTRLTTHPAYDSGPDWSPDGQLVAFHSDRAGNYDIYVTDRQGEGHWLRQLTDHPANDYDASWSPDGNRIAFLSERHGNREIYVMNVNGTHVTRLTFTETNERQPAWSPAGDLIAFESEEAGRPEIYVMDPDGGNVRRLTDSVGNNLSPKWSPDGERLVFASSRDAGNRENGWPEIYVMEPSGAGQTRLTSNSADDEAPAWSPDGQWIALASKRDSCPGIADDAACDWDLYLISPDGSTTRRLTNTPDLSEYNPVWWGPSYVWR
jgi:Tol biopolymer transport system component